MTLTMTRADDDEARIRELVEDWAEAARASDLERVMAHYAPDVVAFDAILRLQFKGADAYREHWQACIGMCPHPMILEIHDLHVAVSGEMAFSHSLARCGAREADGTERTSWMRATSCYHRFGARWLIVHEHWSAPFDPMSGKALLDLSP